LVEPIVHKKLLIYVELDTDIPPPDPRKIDFYDTFTKKGRPNNNSSSYSFFEAIKSLYDEENKSTPNKNIKKEIPKKKSMIDEIQDIKKEYTKQKSHKNKIHLLKL